MSDGDTADAPDLRAGELSRWLDGMQAALRGGAESDVPCAGCTACCRSSQFVHIGPDETETLAHIPASLRFPAPLMPAGHVLLGYDSQGRCPMLTGDGCSIYEHRPRTCRTYDCRVFAATGVELDDAGKELIAQQVRRWRFDLVSDADHRAQEAVRAAVGFIREHAEQLPDGFAPTSSTQLAVLAIEIAEAFLQHDAGSDRAAVVTPDSASVRELLTARTRARGATKER